MSKKRKGFAQLLPKKFFVIYRPAHNDFLALFDESQLEESDSFALIHWHENSSNAVLFDSLSEARQVATLVCFELGSSLDSSLEVRSVFDTGSQWRIAEAEATFFPG